MIFEIDQLPWPMELGVRRQVWPPSVDPEWTGPLRTAIGSASAAPKLVFPLWRARGEVLPGDTQRVSAQLALGGDAVLRQGDFSLLLPWGTVVRWPWGSPGMSANWYVPIQWRVRWRGGTAATRVRTLLLAVGDVLRPEEPAAMLGDQHSASSKEDDKGLADSSSS